VKINNSRNLPGFMCRAGYSGAVSTTGADGGIIAQGGRYSRISLFVNDHRVLYEVIVYGQRYGQLVESELLQPCKVHTVVNLTLNNPAKRDDVPFGPRQPIPATGQSLINGRSAVCERQSLRLPEWVQARLTSQF
jgi:hypothetical protein